MTLRGGDKIEGRRENMNKRERKEQGLCRHALAQPDGGVHRVSFADPFTPFTAFSMSAATAPGCDM
ncbi:hypothetical protein ccbrp13_54740 [Ktedonobacteria bacterium brp13]|nr:hypothetical protein ccbrp13_54740 [Ktedonobacteria bacterium brp13]